MADSPVWRMMHADESGAVYWHGTPQDRVRDDAGEAIVHELRGSPVWNGEIGRTAALELHWSRLDLSARRSTPRLRLAYLTPYGESNEIEVETGVAVWDVSEWDTPAAVWAGSEAATWDDAHLAVGLSGHGRWLVPIARHNVRGAEFAVGMFEAVMHPVAPFPRAR